MVAIELWSIYKGTDVYLWKLINKRMGFVETLNKIRQLCKEFPTIDELIIEDKANGSAIIDSLRYSDGVPPIVAINPLGGKYSRAQAVSPFVATCKVHIPTDFTPSEEAEIEWDGKEKNLKGHQKFIEQHLKFPFAKHDDMVDSETQALSRIIKLITGEEPKPQKRIIRYTKWYPDMWEDYESMNSYEQEKFIATYGAPLEWEDL
jgi:predicted phage terminase large subunit-like protein